MATARFRAVVLEQLDLLHGEDEALALRSRSRRISPLAQVVSSASPLLTRAQPVH